MYQTLTIEEIKDSQNFKDNFFWNRIFFKGIISSSPISDFLYFENSNYSRESKTLKEHGNFYNMLINELPSWQNLPLRNNSIIFTNDFSVARAFAIPRPSEGKEFAKLFAVIPKKGSKLVVSSESDLWYSFSPFFRSIGINKYTYTLTDFNATLKDLASYFDEQDFDMSLENFNQLILEIKNRKVDTCKMSLHTKIIYDGIVDSSVDFLDLLDKNFSPEFNNFHCVNIEDSTVIKSNRELWTNEECILVNFDKFNDLAALLSI